MENALELIERMGLKVGSRIRIINMVNHPEMTGKFGTITQITANGNLIGTWGGLSISLENDKIKII